MGGASKMQWLGPEAAAARKSFDVSAGGRSAGTSIRSGGSGRYVVGRMACGHEAALQQREGAAADELRFCKPRGTWSAPSHLYDEFPPTPFSDLSKGERTTAFVEFTPTGQVKYNWNGSCSCQGERKLQEVTAQGSPASDVDLWADGWAT